MKPKKTNMKLILLSLLSITIFSCKDVSKEIKSEVVTPETTAKVVDSKYPIAMQKVLEAHGGVAAWKSKRTLSFEIPKDDTTEKQTIDLYTRDEKIEMPGVSIGSEGDNIWILDEEEAYKGDPIFYHNLMFYFYSMPFVLSDNGINYSEAEALEFKGISYPGIRISFNDGVGLSAKDEYFIQYNPETFQMEWLGYTVTYRSGEKSDNIKWIRYNDWMDVDGIKLPKSISWYEYEGRTIKEVRKTVNFENVKLSETAPSALLFSKPEGAKMVKSI